MQNATEWFASFLHVVMGFFFLRLRPVINCINVTLETVPGLSRKQPMINASWGLLRSPPHRLLSCMCHYRQWSTVHTKDDTQRRWFPINCRSRQQEEEDEKAKIIYLFINSLSIIVPMFCSADVHFAKSVLTLSWWTIELMECLWKEEADQSDPSWVLVF